MYGTVGLWNVDYCRESKIEAKATFEAPVRAEPKKPLFVHCTDYCAQACLVIRILNSFEFRQDYETI